MMKQVLRDSFMVTKVEETVVPKRKTLQSENEKQARFASESPSRSAGESDRDSSSEDKSPKGKKGRPPQR
jgi:hypothetical protein